MPWLQLVIPTQPDMAIAVSDALTDAGALSVTFEDDGDEPRYQPGIEAVSLWSQTRVTGLFDEKADLDQVLELVQQQVGPLEQAYARKLDDQDWQRLWMGRFKPMRFGNNFGGDNLWVCPSWLEPPEPGAINLVLDPGLAFGTGTHATTALCLQWLASQSTDHYFKDKVVIDYGCGSGILAIAACKLGAARVIATDIDPQALEVTRQNADKNRVSEIIEIKPLEQMPAAAGADVVLANILAAPLVSLADKLTRLLGPGGRLILSGLLDEQVTTVMAAYDPSLNFQQQSREGWAMLSGSVPEK